MSQQTMTSSIFAAQGDVTAFSSTKPKRAQDLTSGQRGFTYRHAAALRRTLSAAGTLCIVTIVVWSAILAKTSTYALPLAAIRVDPIAGAKKASIWDRPAKPATTPEVTPASFVPSPSSVTQTPTSITEETSDIRWFNGRPVRPARSIWIKATGYSPDARSCGDSADGLTATLHSVETNGHRLVAADPRVLPYGSMVTIPGYDAGNIVPVLDCGGAIKGHRLDLLFRTHEEAIKWGVKSLRVVVWEYADGKPADNPRKAR